MSRFGYFLALGCLAIITVASTPAFASVATVPGTHTTIQSAIDSGVDTVLVGNGVFEERLQLRMNLCLLPLVTQPYFQEIEATPIIRGIASIQASNDPALRVRGMRFMGAVNMFVMEVASSQGPVIFERCRFDSAFAGPHSGTTSLQLIVRGCMIFGSLNLEVGYFQFTGNAVIGGGLDYAGDGSGIVSNNDFSGPGPFGIRLTWSANAADVEWNTVHGFEDGIVITGDSYRLSNNLITDCSRDGISLPVTHAVRITDNTVLRCGRYGLYSPPCCYSYISQFWGNVFGRSGSDGVRIGHFAGAIHHNTFFANQGAGLVVEGESFADSISNNISAFNAGPGLAWLASTPPTVMGCNDWFGNGGGPVTGIGPAPTDVHLDPQFCAMAQDDVRLISSSPLLALAGCGLVGAESQGCSAVLGVSPIAEAPALTLRVSPTPARGVVRFTLPPMSAGGRLDVFDVTGARRWGTDVTAGATTVEWRGASDADAPAPAGVYFARLTGANGASTRARILLTR